MIENEYARVAITPDHRIFPYFHASPIVFDIMNEDSLPVTVMSTINLTLSEELDQKLRIAATKQGVEPDCYILNTLTTSLQPAAPSEASLLEKINTGLSQESWQQYHALIKKRQAETLTEEEYIQLIQLTTRLETLNVQRIQSLIPNL
jgi:hypothetical protein